MKREKRTENRTSASTLWIGATTEGLPLQNTQRIDFLRKSWRKEKREERIFFTSFLSPLSFVLPP